VREREKEREREKRKKREKERKNKKVPVVQTFIRYFLSGGQGKETQAVF